MIDVFPPSTDPKEFAPISDCWSELSKDDPYYPWEFSNLSIAELKAMTDEDWRHHCKTHGAPAFEGEFLERMTDDFLNEWVRQTADFKIGEAIRSGALPVYRDDGRRIDPRVFKTGVYLDRSIKGGALRTIERDDREGARLFARRSEFAEWKSSVVAKAIVKVSRSKIEGATAKVVEMMRDSPVRPPAGKSTDELKREIAKKFGLSYNVVRQNIWRTAKDAVPECRWRGRPPKKI